MLRTCTHKNEGFMRGEEERIHIALNRRPREKQSEKRGLDIERRARVRNWSPKKAQRIRSKCHSNELVCTEMKDRRMKVSEWTLPGVITWRLGIVIVRAPRRERKSCRNMPEGDFGVEEKERNKVMREIKPLNKIQQNGKEVYHTESSTK